MIERVRFARGVQLPSSTRSVTFVDADEANAQLAEGVNGVTVTIGDEAVLVPWGQVAEVRYRRAKAPTAPPHVSQKGKR
jgi:ribosomal protein S3